jgi:hypothetical protein
MTTRRSLGQFVAEENVYQECWVCSIPECDEITNAMKTMSRIGAAGIAKWLVGECGYTAEEVSHKAITTHKRNQHGFK